MIENAAIEYLDKKALKLAREKYKEKMNRPYISEEINGMTDEEFLTKLKLQLVTYYEKINFLADQSLLQCNFVLLMFFLFQFLNF